jgi:hypothetical protein
MRYAGYLEKVGLVSSLLIVGVLGGLLAPLPSEAAPTVTINGSPVSLTPRSCDSGYNSCWSITLDTYGTTTTWTVGNVSTTNTARVLINDVDGSGGALDKLKLTGITFQPVDPGGTKTATVVITNVYNAGQGNPPGNYSWGMGMGGYFDPPSAENVVGDRLKLTGSGLFPDSKTLGTLDTGTLASPTTNNLNGSVTKTKVASIVSTTCSDAGNRCRPTITYTFTITVAGQDKLFLTDSVIWGGGTCYELTEVPTVPEGPPDPNVPGVPCSTLAEKIQKTLLLPDVRNELRAAMQTGAVPVASASACSDPETCATIRITKIVPGGGAADITFTYEISGPSSSVVSGTEEIRFPNNQTSSLSIDVPVVPGTYNITEVNEPTWFILLSSPPNCDDGESAFDNDDTINDILVPPGGIVTCTFSNFQDEGE